MGTNSSTPMASQWRIPLTVVLAVTATPLALVAWIFLSGSSERASYLRSGWVRTGGLLVSVGALPLIAILVAAQVGLWPDPRPNPVGLGLFFVAAGAAGCLLALVGVLRIALGTRLT